MESYTENVKRGVALLDESAPGWRDKIDLTALDMSSGCLCILGQVFELYELGVSALWGVNPSECESPSAWMDSGTFRSAVAHGFFIHPEGASADDEWDALQEAWVAELREQSSL